MEQLEARKGHSLEVGGSSPSPAITSVLVTADVYKHIFITLERVHGPWIRPFSLVKGRCISYKSVAQSAEQRSPKPCVEGSMPSTLAIELTLLVLFIGMWLRWLERVPWEHEVAGSSPAIPTRYRLEGLGEMQY